MISLVWPFLRLFNNVNILYCHYTHSAGPNHLFPISCDAKRHRFTIIMTYTFLNLILVVANNANNFEFILFLMISGYMRISGQSFKVVVK